MKKLPTLLAAALVAACAPAFAQTVHPTAATAAGPRGPVARTGTGRPGSASKKPSWDIELSLAKLAPAALGSPIVRQIVVDECASPLSWQGTGNIVGACPSAGLQKPPVPLPARVR